MYRSRVACYIVFDSGGKFPFSHPNRVPVLQGPSAHLSLRLDHQCRRSGCQDIKHVDKVEEIKLDASEGNVIGSTSGSVLDVEKASQGRRLSHMVVEKRHGCWWDSLNRWVKRPDDIELV